MSGRTFDISEDFMTKYAISVVTVHLAHKRMMLRVYPFVETTSLIQ